MKIYKIIVAFSLLLLAAPFLAKADGIAIPPPNREIRETEQKAVIFYENGIEDLILSIKFTGDAKNFAWIIPTPSRPEVNKSSDELFTGLDDLTNTGMPVIPMREEQFLDVGVKSNAGVEVVETKKIDYYDITVLDAKNSDALMAWLKERGYDFPFDEAGWIFDTYIDNGWYFTIVNVDGSKVFSGVEAQFRSGHAVPLKLTFPTDKIVFPLKISSVNIKYQYNLDTNLNFSQKPIIINDQVRLRSNSVGILLYVFSEHKQYLPGFNTLYAAKVDKAEIERLATDDQGNPWKKVEQKKYFLTKLNRNMSQAEMTQDLYLRDATDDQPVNAVEKMERSQSFFWIITAVGIAFTVIFIIILIVIIIK